MKDLLNDKICDHEIRSLSNNLHGFIAADLVILVREASLNALHSGDTVSIHHLSKAACKLKPSCLREYTIDIPCIKWSDIAGQELVKQKLRSAIHSLSENDNKLTDLGINSSKGILMFGPPGCSKTLLAKAIAYESKFNFISVKGPEIFNKWVGETEKTIHALFKRARAASPCVLFFVKSKSLSLYLIL